MTALKFVLGTVQFGIHYGINNQTGKLTSENTFDILQTAYDLGIRELDTADAYGNAQDLLRQFFSQSKVEFKVMSKFTKVSDLPFLVSFEKSLEQLGIRSVEGYYFHRFEDFRNFTEFDDFRSLKKSGKCPNLSVSLYDLADLKFAANHPDVDVIQLPFNVFDRNEEKIELMKKAVALNKKIYIRSAFLQGLFFKKPETLPPKLMPLKEAIGELQSIARESQLSIEELCLNYVYHQEYIHKVIIGVDSKDQLIRNVQSLKPSFDKALIEKIEKIKIENQNLLNPSQWNT